MRGVLDELLLLLVGLVAAVGHVTGHIAQQAEFADTGIVVQRRYLCPGMQPLQPVHQPIHGSEYLLKNEPCTDSRTTKEQNEQRRQVPEHRIDHIVALQGGYHQFQFVKLSVGHAESRAVNAYRLVLVLALHIDQRIVEHVAIVFPLLYRNGVEIVKGHQVAFGLQRRRVVKSIVDDNLSIVFQRVIGLVHYFVHNSVIEQHTPHSHQSQQPEGELAIGIMKQLHTSDSL